MMLKEGVVTDLYGYFYEKVYGVKDFIFYPTAKDVLLTKSFIVDFDGGNNELFFYFCYTFRYFVDMELVSMKRIMFNWIIGKKSLTRYKESITDIDKEAYWNNMFQLKYGISKDHLISNLVSVSTSESSIIEDRKRAIYSNNGELRLRNCLLNTTLYNSKSTVCPTCVVAEDCKLLLRNGNRKIALMRKIR